MNRNSLIVLFVAWICSVESRASAAIALLPATVLRPGTTTREPPAAAQSAPASDPQASTTKVDLDRERALLDEVSAALNASEYTTARAKVVQVVELLLARPEVRQDDDWRGLLDIAARYARSAQDLHTAKLAWGRVLDVDIRKRPADDRYLQISRLNYAVALKELGEVSGARALEEQALDVFSRTLPEDHPHLQAIRLNLAGTIKRLGDLRAARALEEQVLAVYTRTLPDDHDNLQIVRRNYAATIASLGDLAGARALFEKVLEVRARTLPPDHEELQIARQQLGVAMFLAGDLQGARGHFEQVLEVFSRTLPEDHPELQLARGNLADVLRMFGDYQGARLLQEQVLEAHSRLLPDDHADVQQARQGLAVIEYELGNVSDACALFEKVLEVRSRTLTDDHPDLQSARTNVASVIKRHGGVARARELEERVLAVRSRALSEDHPELQIIRECLANTLCLQGDLAAARALQEQVLAVRMHTLPEDHPALFRARRDLATTIARMAESGELDGARARCMELMLASCRARTQAAHAALFESSSREAQARCELLARGLDESLSFAAGYGVFEPSSELDRTSLVLGEATRGAAIGSATMMRHALDSPQSRELRERLRRQVDELASLAQKGTTTAEFQVALASRERTQRELLELARAQTDSTPSGANFDVDELTARLAGDQAVVSLHRYQRSGVTGGSVDGTATEEAQTPSLTAFVLRRSEARAGGATGQLTRVELGPLAPIEDAVVAWREGIGVAGGESAGVAEPARGVGVRPSVDHLADTRGRELCARLVDPLLAAIGDANQVIFVLDDVVHLVALDALPLGVSAEGRTMLVGEHWRIDTRCTLSELLVRSSAEGDDEGVLLALGGAAFGAEPAASGAEDRDSAAEDHPATPDTLPTVRTEHSNATPSILRGSAWESGFAPLLHTDVEARGIAAIYDGSLGGKSKHIVLEQREASRSAFEELAPNARFLHVATHGWFASESIRSWQEALPLDRYMGLGARLSGEDRIKGMSPMLLCGLAFAGANLPDSAVGRARGLITAEEISTLDLSHCELAVLSACDTNVGERRAGQGVASLQRALQMAGARSVITSLWKVPDEATKELMLDFYRRMWIEKKPKWQALWEAKCKLRDAKDERGAAKYTTRDWAAWILTGEPN